MYKINSIKNKAAKLILVFLCSIILVFLFCFSFFSYIPRNKFYYDKSNEVLKNPMTGYAPAADCLDEAAESTLVYVEVTWKELEPTKGEYDFNTINEKNSLNNWKNQGKRVVFRFVCDVPGDSEHMDIPEWLADMSEGNYYISDYGKGYAPDYTDPYFIEAHGRAIKALGDYYGKDDFFAFIELGSIGHWGEWHVNQEAQLPSIPLDSIRKQYVIPYLEAFPNSLLLMRRPFTYAKNYGFGVYNDMTGSKDDTMEWLSWLEDGGEFDQTGETDAIVPIPEIWHHAPIGGEFTSSIPMKIMLKANLHNTVQMIKESHMVFIGPKVPELNDLKNGCRKGSNEILKNIGYRLRVEEAYIDTESSGKLLNVDIKLTNDGQTPFYWDWPVYLYILDKNNLVINKKAVDIKISTLLPGEYINVSESLNVNLETFTKNKLCIGIEDPNTRKPSVIFAMKAPVYNNMTVLKSWDE